MICKVDELKQNLNIEPDYKDDDEYLLMLLEVAEDAVLNYCDLTIEEYNQLSNPTPLKYAIIIIASQYFENRTAISFSSANKIPYSMEFLISPFRKITIS